MYASFHSMILFELGFQISTCFQYTNGFGLNQGLDADGNRFWGQGDLFSRRRTVRDLFLITYHDEAAEILFHPEWIHIRIGGAHKNMKNSSGWESDCTSTISNMFSICQPLTNSNIISERICFKLGRWNYILYVCGGIMFLFSMSMPFQTTSCVVFMDVEGYV